MSNLIPRSIRRNTATPGCLAGDRSRGWSRRDLANEIAMLDCNASLVPFWEVAEKAAMAVPCEDENWCCCPACDAEWERETDERMAWQMHSEFLWGYSWAMQDLDRERAWDARELAEEQKADFLAGK
jgi:hypothetical protein